MSPESPSGGWHDAIVVGAGPAGSMAAWRLARAGVGVLLVDGVDFPRSKPCGDCLSPGATPMLEEMGILEELGRRGASEVKGWRLKTPDGHLAPACFGAPRDGIPDRGIALSRARLDEALLGAAVRAGAEFRAPLRVFRVERTGAGVELTARDGQGSEVRLAARWVIGADGLRSVIARRMHGVRKGRRNRLALVGRYRPSGGVQPGSDGPTEAGVGDLRLSGSGCLGAAAIEDGLWNVTVVVPAIRALEVSADPFGFYRDEVGAYGLVPPAAPGDLATGLEVTGPFEISPVSVSVPGVVLAGDAAGYFDPFTGQGIYRALVSGGRAAAAVTDALAEPERSAAIRRRYEGELHEMFGSSGRLQKLVDIVIHRPRLVNAAGALFERRPGLLSMLLDATGDREAPHALLRPSRIVPALLAGGS